MMLECSLISVTSIWSGQCIWIPWAGCWSCYGDVITKVSCMCPATADFCSSFSTIQHPVFFFYFTLSHFPLVWIKMFAFPLPSFTLATFFEIHQYRWLSPSAGSLQHLPGCNSIFLLNCCSEPLNLQSVKSQKFTIWGIKDNFLINFVSLVNYFAVTQNNVFLQPTSITYEG